MCFNAICFYFYYIESWLSDDFNDSMIASEKEIVRNDRSGKRCGGVGALIKSCYVLFLQFSPLY